MILNQRTRIITFIIQQVTVFFSQGMRKVEQSTVIDIYRHKTPNPPATASTNPFDNPSQSSAVPEHEGSRIKKLEKLIKKKL